MPHFANPWSLFLLLAVPPLVWWSLRQRRGALRFPDTRRLAALPAGRSSAVRWGGALLRGLGLALGVVALAGPRWPDLRTRIPTEGIAVVMAVDVSGSMAEPDFDWQGDPVTRLEAVKRVFRLFVEGGDGEGGHHFDGRPTDLIGLVTFATRPNTTVPLTLSHSVLLRVLDAEQPRHVPGESETNIVDALTVAMHRALALNKNAGPDGGPRRQVIVLLSDGEHNVPHPQSDWSLRQTSQIAANLGIPVYTIDAGGAGGGDEPGAPADTAANRILGRQQLQTIAHITGGQYFAASDTDGLLKAIQSIDSLERSEIRSFQYRRYSEGYPWFALGAFAAWLLVGVLDLTFWRRLP
jgi:Ca-activated chloride channel family protein